MSMFEREPINTQPIRPLISRLKLLGVIKIVMRYDGSGDSGSISDVELEIGQGNPFEGPFPDDERNKFLDYGYELLESMFGGWEINDGSTGYITIDLNTNKVKIHHGEHVSDTRYEDHEIVL